MVQQWKINVICHINKLSKDYHVVALVYAEKARDKIQYSLLTKTVRKPGRERDFINLMKNIYRKCRANTIATTVVSPAPPHLCFHFLQFQLPVVSHSPQADDGGLELGHGAYVVCLTASHHIDTVSSHITTRYRERPYSPNFYYSICYLFCYQLLISYYATFMNYILLVSVSRKKHGVDVRLTTICSFRHVLGVLKHISSNKRYYHSEKLGVFLAYIR